MPLFGKCDLLLIDDDAREIRVVDYKTGQSYPEGEPDPGYERQLRFYRLLLESSPEYSDYRVVSCENWYVEPERKTGQMHDPFGISVTDEALADLNALVNAVWHRLCRADFDTSGFEESKLKAEAVAKGGKKKADRLRELQRAYDRWLIEQDKLAQANLG